jgi:hypothetical protein
VRSLQSSIDLFLTQTCDLHDFGAGTFALDDCQTGRGKIEQLGEEIETRGVGRALHRRRRQPNVQGVSGPAGDRVARSSWLDTEGKGDVRPGNPLTGCG